MRSVLVICILLFFYNMYHTRNSSCVPGDFIHIYKTDKEQQDSEQQLQSHVGFERTTLGTVESGKETIRIVLFFFQSAKTWRFTLKQYALPLVSYVPGQNY